MLITILDGYVDEPSRLGVPPFISPYPRYIAGAIASAGHRYEYLTIDHLRSGKKPSGQLSFIIFSALVPGKYLRSMPMSLQELKLILSEFQGEKIVWSPVELMQIERPSGIEYLSGCDPDAYVFDLLTSDSPSKRRRTTEEWNDWAIAGADLISHHQDFPQPLIAEVDMSFGCPHYISGGCSFCIEPIFGEPVFRKPGDVIAEMKALLKTGCTNFRLGGQSCLFSYMAEGIGETDTPRPNVKTLSHLLKGISSLEGIRVLHTDNANPAVIASHRDESSEILSKIVKTCTGGNVLSLGMESADPEVIEKNNLNATSEEVMKAIKLINKIGAERGPTGMPMLLPGLNFLSGLKGENRETFGHNAAFLESVVKSGYLLRRINIRQVAPSRRKFPKSKYRKEFRQFKNFVRESIDTQMLERIVPVRTVIKDAFTELKQGKLTFARQIGTYPLLVGIPQDLEIGDFLDVKVTDHGSRSITAVEYPLDVNKCQMSALEALPGIGRKRAARLVRARPLASVDDIKNVLDESEIAEGIVEYLLLREPDG
jgi:radical SAM superfamily enzyme with C-terminal helix-hairpin-helix motif